MGAAAAIPAAVRCIALVIPDKRNPHLTTSFQLGTLAHSFPPSRARSIAFATFAAGAPIGGVFGNIIGGVLTQLSRCVRSFPHIEVKVINAVLPNLYHSANTGAHRFSYPRRYRRYVFSAAYHLTPTRFRWKPTEG